ncbi:MAG: hypothetical protein QM805_11285 [Pseudomonas sp.]
MTSESSASTVIVSPPPLGRFDVILEWVDCLHGRDLVEAVVDILAFEESRYRRVPPSAPEDHGRLREAIEMMSANIEEPLQPWTKFRAP